MEIIKTTRKGERSGMIMPLVATIVVFIFLIGIAMLKIGFGSRFIAARTSSEITARSAADAGLASAIHLMNGSWDRQPFYMLPIDLPYPIPTDNPPTYSYAVTGGPNFTIRSTGVWRGISRTVYAMTWATSFWSYAINTEDKIAFKSKIVLDVVPEDSTISPNIRTSSTEKGAVELFPNTELPGDVVVGPGGNPYSVIQVKPSSEIHGDTYAADTAIDFPDVILPEGLPSPVAWPGDPCSVLGTGLYSYGSVNLGAGERLEIEGNVVIYVAGYMRLKNSAQLYIGPNSSLSLYLAGTFIADAGSIITNYMEDARNLCMYGTATCSSIQIKNSGDFWGAIYAPSAELLIYNSGATYGAFTGYSFEMKNSGEFYYDTRLYGYDPTGGLSFFQIERWWERGDEGI